ncbi:hypothetical protein C8Q74DRAFT_102661 [Fomes fomentarius]|nr:hypothetical protein C8Q74DRAFT_102661 [Fomes fomentarius]
MRASRTYDTRHSTQARADYPAHDMTRRVSLYQLLDTKRATGDRAVRCDCRLSTVGPCGRVSYPPPSHPRTLEISRSKSSLRQVYYCLEDEVMMAGPSRKHLPGLLGRLDALPCGGGCMYYAAMLLLVVRCACDVVQISGRPGSAHCSLLTLSGTQGGFAAPAPAPSAPRIPICAAIAYPSALDTLACGGRSHRCSLPNLAGPL